MMFPMPDLPTIYEKLQEENIPKECQFGPPLEQDEFEKFISGKIHTLLKRGSLFSYDAENDQVLQMIYDTDRRPWERRWFGHGGHTGWLLKWQEPAAPIEIDLDALGAMVREKLPAGVKVRLVLEVGSKP